MERQRQAQMRMLAVAFGPPNMAEASAGLCRIRASADCVELRLDLFQAAFDLSTLLRERGSLPVVVTLRPPDQGGRCLLPAAERLKTLLKAAELGAEYIDLEWDAATPQALAAIRAAGAKVIISRHDFSAMPSALADEWWPRLAEQGADIVKVVGTALDVRDCMPVFRALQRADRPTIAIAMGEAGLPTRVLALRSPQCLLTYASLDRETGTAAGQITLDEMRNTYRAERLQPASRVYGLLGPHAEADRLAEYNAWFAEDGRGAVAVPFTADADADGVIGAFRELPVDGWHIHGQDLQCDVVRAVDELSAKARQQGKVNALVRRAHGALFGDWVESPREQYELWR
jgi:3-dehydroquinate dehydratase / shikimate dehydrogenase